VQVNVVVTDKKGEPVRGLTKDDFTLLDSGKPQSISFFAEETNELMAPAGTQSSALVQPAASHTFSNRFEEKIGVPTSVTVILIDYLNTHFTDMAYARNQVVKFLRQLQPQDRVALYSLSGQLRILHDFTTDADALLRALDRAPNQETHQMSGSDFDPADTGDDAVDAMLDAANARMSQFFTTDRVTKTADAIESIASHLSGLPGRKNLVWVSGSFPNQILGVDGDPVGFQSFNQDIENAARALNNANIAIYPVDARGLIAPPLNMSQPGPTARRLQTAPPPRISPARENFDTMNMLADRTGGRAFYNTNDIKSAVRHAIDDSRVTYVLSYYPNDIIWDGHFHEIKVQVKRSSTEIRYRRGYFAFLENPDNANIGKRQMADAVESPLESTELGVAITAEAVDVPGARQLKTHLKFDTGQLRFALKGDRWCDKVDMVWVQLGSDGKTLDSFSQTLDLNLLQKTYDSAQKEGLRVSGTLHVRDNVAEVRFVARDEGTGAIGSLNIPARKLFAESKATPPQSQ
jgi:VWFA-related protein